MNDKILTIITYSIGDEKLAKEFTTFLENVCMAKKVADQSTYVSPLDKEDIIMRLELKKYAFGENDHVTIYYCKDISTTCKCLPIEELAIINPEK